MPDIITTTNETANLRKRVRRLGTVGGLMAGIGGFISITFPMLIGAGMNSELGFTIKEGNEITKAWLDVPLPIWTKVHMFTIENPEAFRRGAKPRVKEMGPYVYKTHRWKEIISWGRNQETVKYYSLASYQFDESKSKGSESDRITIVNVPVYAMAAVVRGLVSKLPLSFAISPVAFGLVNVFFMTHGEGLLKTLTVGEFIGGYPFRILDTVDVLTKPLTWFGIKLPDNGMPQNKFGLLHVKNFTRGDPYEVYTGQGNTKFLKWISFKGKRSLEMYGDSKCDALLGGDGTQMGQFMSTDDIPRIFNGDACRSIYATYQKRTFVAGIPAYRFVLPASMFAGPHKNPDNICFCQTPDDYDMCDGILDLGPCQMGAPLALSFPHLMHASHKIQSTVDGISPDPKKHEAFFDVQPVIGAPMRAAGRLQVNLLMKPNALLVGFGGFRECVLPLAWLEEGAAIEGQFQYMLQGAMFPMLAIDYGAFFAMLGGLGFLGYAGQMAVRKRKIMFPPKSEKDPNKTQTKDYYPDPYTINGQIIENGGQGWNKSPPLYNISEQQFTNREKMNNGSQTVAHGFVGYNQNQQRVSWSPPGAPQ